jgi:hypothetical protein
MFMLATVVSVHRRAPGTSSMEYPGKQYSVVQGIERATDKARASRKMGLPPPGSGEATS